MSGGHVYIAKRTRLLSFGTKPECQLECPVAISTGKFCMLSRRLLHSMQLTAKAGHLAST